jgi:hypothetical protein
MRLFLLVLITLGFSNPMFSQEGDSSIYWGTRKINWKDFRGSPPEEKGDEVARIASGPTCKYYRKGDSVYYDIYCSMDKFNSWSVTDLEYDLVHEIGHFNISEIVTREIRAYFVNLASKKISSWQDIKSSVDSLVDQRLIAFQNLYDAETDYGSDTTKQKEWNQKIIRTLSSMKSYTNRSGVTYCRIAKR